MNTMSMRQRGAGGGADAMDLTSLTKATSDAAQRLLQHYVAMNGARISQMLRKGIETPVRGHR